MPHAPLSSPSLPCDTRAMSRLPAAVLPPYHPLRSVMFSQACPPPLAASMLRPRASEQSSLVRWCALWAPSPDCKHVRWLSVCFCACGRDRLRDLLRVCALSCRLLTPGSVLCSGVCGVWPPGGVATSARANVYTHVACACMYVFRDCGRCHVPYGHC